MCNCEILSVSIFIIQINISIITILHCVSTTLDNKYEILHFVFASEILPASNQRHLHFFFERVVPILKLSELNKMSLNNKIQ